MVQSVNISEEEMEQINQFLLNLESLVNDRRLWDLENIIIGQGLEGVIQAFLSMIMTNFDQSISRFRVYPRYIKKLQNNKVRIHSSTRISPTEDMDITWTLTNPPREFQRYVIESINSKTVPIYEESQRERTEIPQLGVKWKDFMRTYQRVETTNKIYTNLQKEFGKQKAKEFFDDSVEFNEDVDNLFGFLEGPFKYIAYIAVIGANVNGWKGVIMKRDRKYEVIFDGFRDIEALESLTSTTKLTEKEYLNLLTYQWNQRLKPSKLKLNIEVDKTKRRITFAIQKKPHTVKKGKFFVKGERTIRVKKK